MVEDRREYSTHVYRNPGDSIEGDHILIYCRKHEQWESKVRAADGHHYFKTNARMNAIAILRRTFKNLQK